jgi:hypothetical protein
MEPGSFMHFYVISPAAPLSSSTLDTARARHDKSGQLSARNAGSVMTRRYKEVSNVKSV